MDRVHNPSLRLECNRANKTSKANRVLHTMPHRFRRLPEGRDDDGGEIKMTDDAERVGRHLGKTFER